jgi:putative resolvase
MQRYIKLSEYAKNNCITYKTAWSRFMEGRLNGAFKDEFGNILVPNKDNSDYSQCAIYSRVSSNDMKENLLRQQTRLEEFAAANNYNIVSSIKEIGSGMNDNRPKLIKLLSDESWNTLIIEHKDRLTRFGFNYIETLLRSKGKKIVVLNKSDEDKKDLIEDLVSIVYSFSARIYGLRRKKTKKQIVEFLEK